jgi:hypothetical protein
METENLLWGGVLRRGEVGTQSADKEINESKRDAPSAFPLVGANVKNEYS